jgi:hypothetical protein
MTIKAPPKETAAKPKTVTPAPAVTIKVARNAIPGADTTQPVQTAPKPKTVTTNPVVGRATY